MQDNKAQGDFAFPSEWALFGPVDSDGALAAPQKRRNTHEQHNTGP